VIYYYQDNLPISLQYYLKALKIAEETNNKALSARALANVGLIFELQHDYIKALDYYLPALHLKKELGDQAGITAIMTNIGRIYKAKTILKMHWIIIQDLWP